MGMLKRWRDYSRQYGFAGLVRYLTARVLRPVWEASSTQILVLEPPVALREARVPVDIRVMTLDEASSTGLMHPDWAERWSRGHVCYGAWVAGTCVHHSWVTRSDAPVGEVHGRLILGPLEAYVYDCFTAATCRGQGIFPAVLSHVGRLLTAEGVEQVWIAVEDENRSSVKAIGRAGFRPAGEIQYRRLGRSARTSVDCVAEAPRFRFEHESAG
jgi:GNAT superfamily N-acetyltransferase